MFFIFESRYNKTTMGTVLKLNTKKLVYHTQKEGKIFFVRTQMAICYLGVVQVKSVMWIKYK
jgi:hypothetical protein